MGKEVEIVPDRVRDSFVSRVNTEKQSRVAAATKPAFALLRKAPVRHARIDPIRMSCSSGVSGFYAAALVGVYSHG